MNTPLRYATAVLLAIACGGCRGSVSHELLERELLAQENQIYQLQDLVDEYESRLESCHRENESLLAELGRSRTSGKRGAARKAEDGTEEMMPPVVEPGSEGSSLPNGAPLISPPDPKIPEGEHMAKKGKSPRKGGLPGGAKVRATSTAREPIDRFFDRVMVMVEDPKVRANRLALLRTLLREFSTIADFSEIASEAKA